MLEFCLRIEKALVGWTAGADDGYLLMTMEHLLSTTNKKDFPTYEDVATTREACEAIIECNPSHISFLPGRFVDDGLKALALRLGARPEQIPT